MINLPTGMKKLRAKKKIKFAWGRLILVGLVFLALVLALLYAWAVKNMPNPKQLKDEEYPESSLIYDRNGKLLYEMYVEKSRITVQLTAIPKTLKEATLAVEDSNFYKHSGFDFKGLLRGLFRTLLQGRKQGGSTITQQLVKNSLLTPERTLKRKIKEAFLTLATEFSYSKDQILEMYFNRIPYGGTLWGAESASQAIFGKKVSELDLAESALIAGLPASPTKYSPFVYPEKAKVRQELVLARMKELKYIDEETYKKAIEENLNYTSGAKNIKAPHFVFYVKNDLSKTYGDEMLKKGGLRVTTTLDLNLQEFAQNAVENEVNKLVKAHVTNGAALVTEAKTGNILAMVGSKDYFDSSIKGQVNITTSQRQPGSSIKPLNYAVALELGKITPATIFDDSGICFSDQGGKNYCPSNYGNKFFGIQSARNALGNSLNIPAVKVLKLNGIATFVASASAMGISTFKNADDYGLSLTLGAGEVLMTDMNVAFGVFANGGVKQELNAISKVTDRSGKVLDEYVYTPGDRVLSRETAFMITNMLSDDGARSMVFGSGSFLNIKKHPEVAVKTGTTNDLRDNWTIGYNQDYVTTVWVGNSDNSKMSSIASGTTGAAPIWNKIMTFWLADKPVKRMPQPVGIVSRQICNNTGMLVPPEGCESKNEYFKQNYVPPVGSILKMQILVDKTTNKQAKESDYNINAEMQEKQVIIDPVSGPACLDCSK